MSGEHTPVPWAAHGASDALAEALEALIVALEKIDASYIGESMHTGLRKGSEADDAATLWRSIADSRTGAWSDAAAFTVGCIDFHFGKDVARARAALSLTKDEAAMTRIPRDLRIAGQIFFIAFFGFWAGIFAGWW